MCKKLEQNQRQKICRIIMGLVRITQRNLNKNRKYFKTLVSGPDGINWWTNRGRKSRWTVSLKGVCHKIFELHFFHDSNPSGPLIKRVKYFRIRFQFSRDIQIFKKLCSVHHTVESSSVVCIIPWSLTLRCASYRGVKLCGVHHTLEFDSALCIILQSQTQRCSSHQVVMKKSI